MMLNNVLMLINYKIFEKYLSMSMNLSNNDNLIRFYNRFTIFSLYNDDIYTNSHENINDQKIYKYVFHSIIR